ncbi:MAG: Na+/H+ antiporter subunit E [Acidimicrobiia bacterium]|nr:Na+/H+ antiporter subunit E [Acidimicrobiia bacterium]
MTGTTTPGRFVRRMVEPAELATLAVLTALWCALWGEASIANVASGLAVALVAGRTMGPRRARSIRLGPLARFHLLVAADLVVSTVVIVREILTWRDDTDEIVISVQLPAEAADHLLMVTAGLTVTPGTAVVEVDRERAVVHLHLLHASRADSAVAHARRLATLAAAAFPMRDGRAEAARATGTDGAEGGRTWS